MVGLYAKWVVLPLALVAGACGSTDQFAYTSRTDDFEGGTISEAKARVMGDGNIKNILEVSVTCRNPETASDPIENATISFRAFRRGEGDPLKDFAIKLDDAPPIEWDEVTEYDTSEYSNELTLNYLFAVLAGLDPNLRANVLLLGAAEEANPFSGFAVGLTGAMMEGMSGGKFKRLPEEAVERALFEKARSAKTLKVRYETERGTEGTATLDIQEDAFRKVLRDCGWLQTAAAPN
ncbi:hypothetical protein A6F68_00125 [Tsuneonella dongtanensis]|uniref:Lipoprotein n=1 Tax=Tsuneonella dongtanensis TaxID=692370 RepID=A0A1B2A976_9SPHN|nr:hypothetical protein [Tsuneonella dongtanensis]ANY18661.1 hypothetical protein A6F68_00125 [Tsuneonella dongtanensis]